MTCSTRTAGHLFAQAAAVVGIRSSLSLPVRDEGRIVGGVNLYASTRGAFDASHEAIARVVGAQAEEAVRDADLSFSSRTRAMETPGGCATSTWSTPPSGC